jgi:hypothetical protein
MYYEYVTTQYFVRFFLFSVNNRGRAPSKYVNKLAIGFYFFIPEVKKYGQS